MSNQSIENPMRDQAIKAIMRDFPELPKQWCEMTYDFCVKHPEESDRIREKIEAGKLPPKERPTAGELSSVEII